VLGGSFHFLHRSADGQKRKKQELNTQQQQQHKKNISELLLIGYTASGSAKKKSK
jgi:hypothetical protein